MLESCQKKKICLAIVLLSASHSLVCFKTQRSLLQDCCIIPPSVPGRTNSGGCWLANSAVLGLLSHLTFTAFHPQGGSNLIAT